MSIKLNGNWKIGFAHDVHTLSSTYMGVNEYGRDRWDTTRSEMGELVYQLKYQNNRFAITKIVDLLSKYKGLETMDAIIPVPCSNKNRPVQPVYEIAQELGKRVRVQVLDNVLIKADGGSELKNIDDPQIRKELLKKYMSLSGKYNLTRKNVLLVDDLYRSGATLAVATDILYQQARVKDVYVLAMTITRSKR
jgi:competence protein ComFC